MTGDAVGHSFGHRRPIHRPIISVAAALAVIAACGSSKSASPAAAPTTVSHASTTTTIDPDGPFAVGRRDVTFVDTTRSTSANGSFAAKPSRTLDTIIEYPAVGTPAPNVETEGAAPANGRFPVALFVHGFGAHADNLYLHYWAAAGFIAVSIKFPLTNTDTPGGPKQADVLNEPGDVSFVLSRIAHLPARDADLQPIIDATRVGLMGQSLGATVVFDLGFNKRYHDARIKAVVPMSGGCVPCGPGIGEGDGVYFTGPSLPVMFIHGNADPVAPIEHSAQEYAQAPAPKFFVRMIGALHVQFGPPWDQVAAQATIDFFDHYLKNESDGLTRLRTDASVAGKAELQAAT
jgi:predicted dienelactone hydrolase